MDTLPTPGAPETDAVRAMFDRIAPRYDALNHWLSLGIDKRWRRRALDVLGLPAGSQLLDLCTGTGDVLCEWLWRSPKNRGTGFDLSGGMLRLGQEKLRALGLAARAELVAGDSVRLPFRNGAFDGAIVGFGLRNVAQWAEAAVEVARVLKPGGAFVVLEFGWPRGVLGALYSVYFRQVLPRIGRIFSSDSRAYSYLPASVRLFPRGADFAEALRKDGWADVAWQPLTGGIAWLCRCTRPPLP